MRSDGLPFAIVGLGFGGTCGLTGFARARLEVADVIFALEAPAIAAHMLDGFAGEIVSMDSVFDEEPNRREALIAIAARIADRAAGCAAPALALQGHPLFARLPAQRLLAIFRERGTPVEVMAGTSSVDVFCADFGIDPLSHGIQIVAGAQAQRLSGALPVIMLSPAYASTTAYVDRLAAMAHCVRALIETYGDHSVFLIYRRETNRARFEAVAVGDLIKVAGRRHLGDVLIAGPLSFFPGVALRVARDSELE